MVKIFTGLTWKSNPKIFMSSVTMNKSYLIIKKRQVPMQMHIWNFYGDLKDGYFAFPDKTFFCSSISLGNRDDVVWMLVPKQLTSGKIIAWPHFRSATGKLTQLKYLTQSR